MKRFLKFIPLLILAFPIIFVSQNYPFTSKAKHLTLLSDTNNIKNSLDLIIKTNGFRTYNNIDVLDTVAERLRLNFIKHTPRVTYQNYTVNESDYKNVIASFGPENAERIIVGAHYDVCGNQDGADDNASGVAGLLELARLLQHDTLNYRIDLVAYTLEEPPYFGTEYMGSYVHAKSLKEANIAVKGMISLEMIGYYSDQPNTQQYPFPIMKWIYGDKGDYITIVQKSFSGDFSEEFKEHYFDNNSIIAKNFTAPKNLGGISFSDHRNYWQFDYSAVMVTNTAFFRNTHYHKTTDQLKTLNITKMAQKIDGVYRSLLKMQ
ncbi:M28 family peptidase [Cyclobacteriaceae bacterium]|nr:M28 family peptidase [Cyclobacteriaceae bacterium]